MELQLEGLSKTYGTVQALRKVTYTFKPGIYGILGANGAGKSTMINLITDNVSRDSGSDGGKILYDGEDILKLGKRFRAIVGYMPQQQGFYESFSARMFLVYMAELKGLRKKEAKKQIENLLEIVHLSHVADKKIGGMKQRVLLAQALLGDPKLLILDEPTAGLDPKERVNLRNYIHQLSQNKIILLATHVVSDVESIADRILIMKAGELVADDTPEHLVRAVDGNNLEDVYMNYFGDKGEK